MGSRALFWNTAAGLLCSVLVYSIVLPTRAYGQSPVTSEKPFGQRDQTDLVRVPRAELLRDWALARCVGKAFGAEAEDDADISASALLEAGKDGMDIYNKIDTVIDKALAQTYGGSVKGNYNTLKCIDLYHSKALRELIDSPLR